MTQLPSEFVGDQKAFVEEDYTPTKEKINPFDFLKSINSSKKTNLMRGSANDEIAEKQYNPWLVNLGLSYHLDTLLHANEINMCHDLDNRPQYEFLLNSVRPSKRYSKWYKPEENADLDMICEHYQCNRNVGIQYLSLLSNEQINEIKNQRQKGGIVK